MNLQDGNFFVVAKPILVERRQTTPKPILISEEDLKVFEEKLEKEKLKEDIALSMGNICNVPYSRKGALDYQEIDVKRVKKVLKKPFKCTICDLSYTKRDSLDRHDKKVHEMKRFRCDLCDKIYKEQGNLSIHKRDVIQFSLFESKAPYPRTDRASDDSSRTLLLHRYSIFKICFCGKHSETQS